MSRPHSVSHAVQVIWATNAASAFLIISNFDGTDAGADSLISNGLFLLFYFSVTVKVGQGRQWARWTYACLVALECAILAAFGLEQASDLESLMTYLTLPVEILALYWLFGAQADDWFRPTHSEPT
jgi:hypothetical protein